MEGTETGWGRPAEPAPRWRALLDRALLGGRTTDQPADDDTPAEGDQRAASGAGHRGRSELSPPAREAPPLPSRPVSPLDPRAARTPVDRRSGAAPEPQVGSSAEQRPGQPPAQRPVNPFEKRPAPAFAQRPAPPREPRPINPLDRRAGRTFDGYAGRATPVNGGQPPEPPHSFFNPVPRPGPAVYPPPAGPAESDGSGYPAAPPYRAERGYPAQPAPGYPVRPAYPAEPGYSGYPAQRPAGGPAPVPVVPHSTHPDPTQPDPPAGPGQPGPEQPGPTQPGPSQPGPTQPGPGPTQPSPTAPSATRSAVPGAAGAGVDQAIYPGPLPAGSAAAVQSRGVQHLGLARGTLEVGPARTAPVSPAGAAGGIGSAVLTPGPVATGAPGPGQPPAGIEWRQSGGDGETERAISVLRRAIGGPRVLAFANPKGGVHKTTATVLAAASVGSVRGRGVLAWDDNELRGTLGLRAGSARHARTIRHLITDLALLENLHGEDLTNRLDDYLRHAADGSYDVLAGEESPRFAQRLDHTTVRRIMDLLRHTHDVICVDTGNNVESVNWQTVLQTADQLVVTTVPREDAAFTADWMLDLLHEIGMGELASNAVTLLSCSTPGRSPLLDDLTRHFATRTRAVAVVPYDPALETGSSIEYGQLQPATRDAWLRASSVMLEPFAH